MASGDNYQYYTTCDTGQIIGDSTSTPEIISGSILDESVDDEGTSHFYFSNSDTAKLWHVICEENLTDISQRFSAFLEMRDESQDRAKEIGLLIQNYTFSFAKKVYYPTFSSFLETLGEIAIAWIILIKVVSCVFNYIVFGASKKDS